MIRSVQANDYDYIKKIYSDKKTRKYLGGTYSDKNIEKIFKDILISKEHYFLVFDKKNNDFVGLVSFTKHHNEVDMELSYQFISTSWGKGYAYDSISILLKKVFNDLGLDKLVAETQKLNKKSCHLLKKLGMTEQERLVRFGAEQIIFKYYK
jgi:ribosomal-protein-alanine N-acetyltransferase